MIRILHVRDHFHESLLGFLASADIREILRLMRRIIVVLLFRVVLILVPNGFNQHISNPNTHRYGNALGQLTLSRDKAGDLFYPAFLSYLKYFAGVFGIHVC